VVQALYFGLHCSATEVTTSWLKHHSVFTVHAYYVAFLIPLPGGASSFPTFSGPFWLQMHSLHLHNLHTNKCFTAAIAMHN